MELTYIDFIFLAASAWLLWQGYTFLGDRDIAWRQYVERQEQLGKQRDNIQRTPEWERSAMIQGIIYTCVGTFGILITVFA